MPFHVFLTRATACWPQSSYKEGSFKIVVASPSTPRRYVHIVYAWVCGWNLSVASAKSTITTHMHNTHAQSTYTWLLLVLHPKWETWTIDTENESQTPHLIIIIQSLLIYDRERRSKVYSYISRLSWCSPFETKRNNSEKLYNSKMLIYRSCGGGYTHIHH